MTDIASGGEIQNFHGKSIVSIDQFAKPDLDALYAFTDDIITNPSRYWDILKGKLVTEIFFEASSRTFASFSAAAQRLGARTTEITGVQYSSITKGESFEDTIRTFGLYADALVIRTEEAGHIAQADQATSKPVVNAGDGTGEHPTQALLDGYAIGKMLGGIDGKVVTLVGDLKHGRTVHSLVRLLSRYDDVQVQYLSPDILAMPDDLQADMQARGLSQDLVPDIETAMATSDVVYMTRVQRERFDDLGEYMRVKDDFILGEAELAHARNDMIVMHPLPRVNELSTDVDHDPRVVPFEQARLGMFVRMALLASILEDRVIPRDHR